MPLIAWQDANPAIAMNARQTWLLVKTAFNAWYDDYAQSMGAALAYYTMFSITPVLLIAISIAGLVFGEEAARGEIAEHLENLMGPQGALAVQSLLDSVRAPAQGLTATVVGVVLLLVGATSVFGELQNALDRIWRAPGRLTAGGLLGLVRSRLLSFGMILGIGFILMVSLVFSAALSALTKWWSPAFGEMALAAHVVNLGFSFALTTGMFALIYKIMPRVRIAWSEVRIGAALTALLFTVGKAVIGFYIGRSGVASGFGAAGSLVALMVWVYYSAQIFLMGAEFTWAYSHVFGSRRQQAPPAELVQAIDESAAVCLGPGRLAAADDRSASHDRR